MLDMLCQAGKRRSGSHLLMAKATVKLRLTEFGGERCQAGFLNVATTRRVSTTSQQTALNFDIILVMSPNKSLKSIYTVALNLNVVRPNMKQRLN